MKKLLPAAVVLCVAAWTLALAGCPSSTNGDPAQQDPVNKTELVAAITAANTAKTGVAASTDGSDIETTAYWALQSDINTFTAAIDSAETVFQNAAVTQAQVNAAETALTQATAAFNEAKSAGTKPVTPGKETVSITLVFADGGVLTSGATENPSINRSGGETLTVTAAEGLADYQWSLNNAAIPAPRGTAQSITIAAVNYPAGKYLLGLAAKKGSVDYSTVISFTVEE
jgi:hypothetical protein